MQKLLDKVVSELKSISGVEAIYLFGSCAKGKAKPFSDIDICVVTRRISESKKSEILSISSKKIDTSIFWDLPPAIQYRVIKEGKPLFIGNELFLHRVRVGAISRYLDFKPVLERRFNRMIAG